MSDFSSRGLVPLPGFEEEYAYVPPRTNNPVTMQQPYWQHPIYVPHGYRPPTANPMPGPQFAYPIVQNLQVPIVEDEMIIKSNKERAPRKKRTEIEGETVVEIVNNIIKENATLKQAKDAFKKIVRIMEEDRELTIFEEF